MMLHLANGHAMCNIKSTFVKQKLLLSDKSDFCLDKSCFCQQKYGCRKRRPLVGGFKLKMPGSTVVKDCGYQIIVSVGPP